MVVGIQHVSGLSEKLARGTILIGVERSKSELSCQHHVVDQTETWLGPEVNVTVRDDEIEMFCACGDAGRWSEIDSDEGGSYAHLTAGHAITGGTYRSA